MDTPYLVFGLRDSRFAIDVDSVREIVWLPELSPIEELPPDVAGVFDLHGLVVPVVDLHARFGRAPERLRVSDQVIVVKHGDASVGVIANQLFDVVAIPAALVSESSVYQGAGGSARFVRGEARLANGLAMLLDVDTLVNGSRGDVPFVERDPLTADESEVFRKRAQTLSQTPERSDSTGLESYAVVRLAREFFGLGLAFVREFVHLRGIVPVPCCPPHIAGNMNLRGDVLTIVDLRAMLGVRRDGETTEVAVLAAGELRVGVLAAEIVDVLHVAQADVRPVPVTGAGREYSRGVVMHEGRVVTLLDVERILAADELRVEEQVQ